MNRFDHTWNKLIALARQAPDERTASAPYGFSTRVAARATALPPANPWAICERFAVRGLLVAAGLCLAAVVLDYSTNRPTPDDDFGLTDSVSDLLNIS